MTFCIACSGFLCIHNCWFIMEGDTMCPQMADHKTSCPRCGKTFVCRAEDIRHCSCASVTITDKTLAVLRARYHTCVCIDCLHELNNQYKDD